ncbi:MAG: divergent polysaccharide deacetylase family protein [Proteobacteria bacterium]|nr:divergent polysaccharide deacetylase family protein [Pseudomonadota bacterium]
MPPKKKAANKRAPSKSQTKKKPEIKQTSSLLKSVTAIFIIVAIATTAGFLAHLFLPPKRPAIIKKPSSIIKKIPAPPVFEIYTKEEPDYHPPATLPVKPKNSHVLPFVSIIIDDLGYDYHLATGFLELNTDLTFSILPHSPHGTEIAELAHQKNVEIMLHLPMEPFNYPKADPGPGTLFESMSPDKLIDQLTANLDSIPYIKGVNNHMGSKISTNEPQIHQIFSILKKRNLFFIDSRTTNKTICQPAARLFQIPFAQRNIFLDNRQDAVEVQKQIFKLVKMAESKGEVVGIGHAYQITLDVLRELLPWMKQKVTIVPASKIAHLVETQI